MALGAQPVDILRLIFRKGMLFTFWGLASGLVIALTAMRLLGSFLYGVTATDAVTFSLVSALLAGTALLACYIPARRAAKIDPAVTLRPR
jgi:putative ABC transport system permease protein